MTVCNTLRTLAGMCLGFVASAAWAGPPYLTDDPEPTETGHLENYVFVEAHGTGSAYGGATGVEVNFGAVRDVQLTMVVPLAFEHASALGQRQALGDIKISAKYRFFHDENAGVSAAVFPGISLPTASTGLGAGRVTVFLPVWVQKDAGPWTIFGGGGYAINPGSNNRDFWEGGVAVTREVSHRLSMGVEVHRHGPDAIDARGETSLGLGVIYKMGGPFALLGSAGPTFNDAGGPASFHLFIALGIDL